MVFLAVKLNAYIISAKALELIDNYTISGYHANEWMEDILAKLDIASRKDEELKLKEMERKLDVLLSNEKKVELELDSIESMLKD